MPQDAAEQIAHLRDQIRHHDHKYYVEAAPEISDREYDRLIASLEAFEAAHPEVAAPDSPTRRVADEPVKGLAPKGGRGARSRTGKELRTGSRVARQEPRTMDYVAIDFETASSQRVSACAVGAAVVRDGRVADVFHTLIRPPTLEFDSRLTAIHGITAEDVREAPTFKDIWPHLKKVIGTGPIAAHNAPFDIGVLLANLESSRIAFSERTYFCTLELARTILPGLPNHRLNTLATVFGIPLDHHDPASDAVACATLGSLLIRLVEPNEFRRYVRDISAYGASEATNPTFSGAAIRLALEIHHTEAYDEGANRVFMTDAAPPDGRFEGQRFVFTGELVFLTRSEATRIVELQGGKSLTSVSAKTTHLVVGDDAWAAHQGSGHATGKLAKALDIQNAGGKIKIIRETEFFQLCGRPERMESVPPSDAAIEDEAANLRHLKEI